MPNDASVAILLATYNGAPFIAEQLRSLVDQTAGPIDLIISDDGSTDGTIDAVDAGGRRMAAAAQRPRKGFHENFRHLILHAPLDDDFYAFCDQDDVWQKDKLATAIAALRGAAGGRAGALLQPHDDGDRRRHADRPVAAVPQGAGVQECAGAVDRRRQHHGDEPGGIRDRPPVGRTHLVRQPRLVVLHAGDRRRRPGDLQRRAAHRLPPARRQRRRHQHRDLRQARRASAALFGGRFAGWNARNIEALLRCRDLLRDDVVATIEMFDEARRSSLIRNASSRSTAPACSARRLAAISASWWRARAGKL